MFAVAVVLLTTGALAMIYEIVMLREFTVLLGSSFYAGSVVISAVMLGLSVGAALFGRLADVVNAKSMLLALELLIAVTSLFIVQTARHLFIFDWELLLQRLAANPAAAIWQRPLSER